MKKSILAVLAGVLALSLLAGCSREYVHQKTEDGMNITLKALRYPLSTGDNALSASIADSSGKPVGDAAVAVRYYLAPLPGMASLDYSATTQAKDGGYAFTANIPMGGEWKVDVTATQPGKPAVTATFTVDAE